MCLCVTFVLCVAALLHFQSHVLSFHPAVPCAKCGGLLRDAWASVIMKKKAVDEL